MYKVNTLFDASKHVKRQLPQQEVFEKNYNDLLVRMLYLMDRAFSQMATTRGSKSKMAVNRNWSANEMNGNLWDLIAKEFPHYIMDTKRGNYCLNLNDKFQCYIKKLTKKNLQPLYNHSETSRQLCDQIAPVGIDPIPIIYIGYTASKKMEVLTGYFAVCVKENEVIWCSDITALLPVKRETSANTETIIVEPKVNVEVKLKKKAQ